MPELPEVETVRRGLAARITGHRLARVEVRRPDLRYPMPERLAARLKGRRITDIGRRAKYLLIHLDDGMVLLLHLGMSGRLVVGPVDGAVPETHDHVELITDDGARVVFNDARRFGLIDLVPADALDQSRHLAGLGPEPLGNFFSGAYLTEALAGRTSSIKAALLDQRLVAGLGNIYVSEALWEAAISPRRTARSVAGKRAERLAPAIKQVLERAIAAGGSSLRDYVQASGELGYFQHQWKVYDREGLACLRRDGTVRRIVQANRSTFYCPSCQR